MTRRGRSFWRIAHEVSFPRRDHRRRFPLREHLGLRHPGAGRSDREGGRGSPRPHELRRSDVVRAAVEPRLVLHPVDRRRRTHARRNRPGRRAARARDRDHRAARVRHRSAPPQCRHPDLPVRRDAHLAPSAERHPARAARLHPHVRGHAGVRRAPHHPRGEGLSRLARAAVLQGTRQVRGRRLVFVALPRPLGRRRVPEEPARPDVPPVLRREHAARGRLQRGRRTRPAARPYGPRRGVGAQRGAHLQRRSSVLRDQRHVDVEQDRLARDRRAGRHRARRSQLPQVDPARDHDDGRDPRVPHADAQPLRESSARFRATSSSPRTSARRSRRTRSRAKRCVRTPT